MYSLVQVPDVQQILSLVLLVYFRLESNSVDIYTNMGQECGYPNPIPSILLLLFTNTAVPGYIQLVFLMTIETSICTVIFYVVYLSVVTSYYVSIICSTCRICMPFIFTPISDAFQKKSRNTKCSSAKEPIIMQGLTLSP